MSIKKGDSVGDYQVIDLVGSGGMGAVYKIEHIITKRIEAMKLLPLGVSSGPEEVQRFEREIQVQARLHHPNIAALYNAVRDGNSIALIMEYVEGESLQQMLEGGRLSIHIAVNYANQILDALAYAHEHGVVHRDVSPANIIITPEGTAKLTDFGLARSVKDLRLTASGVAVGSPWYMSPEQVRAVDEPDGRTDLYSLGAVLHEMLTGRKMFDADGSFAVMSAQIEVIPPPPSLYNAVVSPALDEVVAKALAKDPAERYQSAGEFRVGLDAAIEGMRTAAGASRGEAGQPGRRPSRMAMALVLTSAILATVVCAMWLWSRTKRVEPRAQVPQEAVASEPAPVTAPQAVQLAPPDGPAASPTPEVAAEPVESEAAPATVAVRSMRRTSKPDQRLAIRVSGGVVESPAPISRPNPPSNAPATATDTPGPQPEVTAVPEPPVASAPPGTPAKAEAAKSTEDVKPPKTGNRLIRALGKINPFAKGAKSAPADAAKGVAKRN